MSIQITVDPFNATKRPDIKFLGSERAIIPFKKSLTEKFQVTFGNITGIITIGTCNVNNCLHLVLKSCSVGLKESFKRVLMSVLKGVLQNTMMIVVIPRTY